MDPRLIGVPPLPPQPTTYAVATAIHANHPENLFKLLMLVLRDSIHYDVNRRDDRIRQVQMDVISA